MVYITILQLVQHSRISDSLPLAAAQKCANCAGKRHLNTKWWNVIIKHQIRLWTSAQTDFFVSSCITHQSHEAYADEEDCQYVNFIWTRSRWHKCMNCSVWEFLDWFQAGGYSSLGTNVGWFYSIGDLRGVGNAAWILPISHVGVSVWLGLRAWCGQSIVEASHKLSSHLVHRPPILWPRSVPKKQLKYMVGHVRVCRLLSGRTEKCKNLMSDLG